MTMTEKPNEQNQDIQLTEQQPADETSSVVVAQSTDSIRLLAAVVLVIAVLGIGYLLLQSNKPDQVSVAPTPSPTVQISPTPIIKTNNPTASPSSSLQPSTKPVATKKPVPPSPSPITGVDARFSDVHFYGKPEPNTTFTPHRVPNGGSISVSNEKNDSELELFALFVNHGTDEAKDIWVHYFVDGVEVKKGIAYLPGNMVKDELVTRDSAQPVKIPASGSHTVKIVIDPDNNSKDINHANNTYTFNYTVK